VFTPGRQLHQHGFDRNDAAHDRISRMDWTSK
jgi:hypothetical protein